VFGWPSRSPGAPANGLVQWGREVGQALPRPSSGDGTSLPGTVGARACCRRVSNGEPGLALPGRGRRPDGAELATLR